MKHVGRIILSQEDVGDFFNNMPEGMRILEAIVTQFRVLPPEIEFVFDWNGFDSIPDECIPPVYTAERIADKQFYMFKRI